jgi:hypothetical protein
MGRDVRAWAIRCNGGSNLGIGLRLPCTKQGDEKPLFDCPELDRKTDAEVDAERAEMKAAMDRLITALPKLNAMRAKMIANNLPSAVATCPWCDEKDALRVNVALSANNHMRAQCKACGEGFIE